MLVLSQPGVELTRCKSCSPKGLQVFDTHASFEARRNAARGSSASGLLGALVGLFLFLYPPRAILFLFVSVPLLGVVPEVLKIVVQFFSRFFGALLNVVSCLARGLTRGVLFVAMVGVAPSASGEEQGRDEN